MWQRLRLARLAAGLLVLFASGGLPAEAGPILGRTILALYKSSEGQSATDNEIVSYVEPVLRALGLSVRYHDADSGVPGDAALRDVRGVVSWFRGPSMGSPERYLGFVRDTVDSGRKFMVLDNMGAYQERGSGRWLESGELNLTLSRFGLQYWGDWSDDTTVVSLRSADSSVFHLDALKAAGIRPLYYRFIAADRDLEILLSAERRDRSYGASPVAVANRNGAFVLSSYLSANRNGAQELYVDFAALLQKALFGRAREERVAVLSDAPGADPPAVSLAERVLRTGRIPAEVLRAADLPLLVPGDLRRFTVVALALGSAASVDDRVLADYLSVGGSVLCLGDALPESVRSVIAASASQEPAAASGMRFASGFLTSEGFFLEDRELPWTAGTLRPASGASVLATDWLDATPLLWTIRAPAGGTVAVWNARDFWKAEHAGLLMESFLACRPVGGCVTPALAAIRIDGFPRPLYNVVQKPLTLTDTDFYRSRFWPDLRDLLGKHGIPLNATVLWNYNDRTSPPFWGGELYMAERQASVELVREAMASGAEVGLFGYNHISLETAVSPPNSRSWPTREAMEGALRTVRAEWRLLFGEEALPRSYAAPYGLLSAEGLEALRSAFPEIRVAGTLVAAGDLSDSGFTAPGSGEVRIEPASSSGYLYTERTRRLMVSAILGEGVWLHAIDADDVLDPTLTGGRKWEELTAELERVIAFQARHYPWLKFARVSELAQELRRLEETEARFELGGTSAGVTTYAAELPAGTLLRLRFPGLKIQGVEGGEVVFAYTRADAAVIRATSGRVVVRLVRKA